jgi:2,3-bisphosphoglycerate-independent phosphoglycerate mutase
MMTEYSRTYPHPSVFKPETHTNVLGDWLSQHGVANLRTAETEKYPHVTYFFNGGVEKVYEGEARELVASPKVATYDLMPEMSAAGVADVVVRGIESGKYGVIVVNFANPDMVGHSGKFEAAVKAVEAADICLGQIEKALEARGNYAWLITADHGNSETMIDPVTKGPHTYHTTNPVPFILVNGEQKQLRTPEPELRGSLRDIAPTILDLLEIPKPAEMTGVSLRA